MGTEPGIIMGTYLSTEPGYLIITEDGRRSQLAISEILRAADIPALTYAQVGAIKTLANSNGSMSRFYEINVGVGLIDDDYGYVGTGT